jgi:hypothetical protein
VRVGSAGSGTAGMAFRWNRVVTWAAMRWGCGGWLVFSGTVCKGCGRIGTFVITVDIATEGWTGAILGYPLRNTAKCNSDTQHKTF